MKKYLLTVNALFWITLLSAQVISLPNYTEGVFERDTLFNYYGELLFTGNGKIEFGEDLTTELLPGVRFQLFVDSIDMAGSTSPTAFRDSAGQLLPVAVGHIFDLPINLKLFAGAIGFQVLLEGTPMMVGDTYFCDLRFDFLPGNDWGLRIYKASPDLCLVDQLQNTSDQTTSLPTKVYPNPFQNWTQIELPTANNALVWVYLFDLQGKMVSSTQHRVANQNIRINRGNLPAGSYFFQVLEDQSLLARGNVLIR